MIVFLRAFRSPRSRRYIYMLLLLAGVHGLNAQDPLKLVQLNHTSWTAREGAPSEIAGLGQTADGVLWIGSGSGLYRFDGTSFSRPFLISAAYKVLRTAVHSPQDSDNNWNPPSTKRNLL